MTGRVDWVPRLGGVAHACPCPCPCPVPATVIAAVLGGLVVTAFAAIAAAGDPVVVGEVNISDARTRLTGKNDASILQVVNRGTAPTRVPQLNADRLDGRHASSFLRKNARAANSHRLDGLHANQLIPRRPRRIRQRDRLR